MNVYVISAAFICAISCFLIMHNEYEDGVLGRLSLTVLAISNGLIVSDWWIDGSQYQLLPNTLATQCAMAAFLVRHCYRFLRWKNSGENDWRRRKRDMEKA